MVVNCKEMIIKKYFILDKLSASAESKGLFTTGRWGYFLPYYFLCPDSIFVFERLTKRPGYIQFKDTITNNLINMQENFFPCF